MATKAEMVAVVTGSNKGIGWNIAQKLKQTGKFKVIMACRNAELGEPQAKTLDCSFEQLDIGSDDSIVSFAERVRSEYGRLDILVNNAGTAFKQADPTPFKEQTKPTLAVNFYGTVRLTEQLLPLLRESAANGQSPRIVNVASMTGRLAQLKSENLRLEFASPTLTKARLNEMVGTFESEVEKGNHKQEWSTSNYGFSKLCLIAYTRIVAREEAPGILVNSICPGYCDTDMTSHKGPRHPSDGAKLAVQCVLLPDGGETGKFWENGTISEW